MKADLDATQKRFEGVAENAADYGVENSELRDRIAALEEALRSVRDRLRNLDNRYAILFDIQKALKADGKEG